jgi:hypothetical protein
LGWPTPVLFTLPRLYLLPEIPSPKSLCFTIHLPSFAPTAAMEQMAGDGREHHVKRQHHNSHARFRQTDPSSSMAGMGKLGPPPLLNDWQVQAQSTPPLLNGRQGEARSTPLLNGRQGQAWPTPSSMADRVKLGPPPSSRADRVKLGPPPSSRAGKLKLCPPPFRASSSWHTMLLEVIDLISSDKDSDDVLLPPPPPLLQI